MPRRTFTRPRAAAFTTPFAAVWLRSKSNGTSVISRSDNHEITIEIEDADLEEEKLKYLPDSENCNISPDARVPGWDFSAGEAAVTNHGSNTNYGDIDLPSGHESNWSRYIYTVHMTRTGYGYFGKLFTGLFIAVGISLVGLLTSPEQMDSKFALSVGAMFAAVASEYLVTASLPDSNVLTMADKLHILSFLFIFLTLAQATLAHKVFASGRERGRQVAGPFRILRAVRWLCRAGRRGSHLEAVSDCSKCEAQRNGPIQMARVRVLII